MDGNPLMQTLSEAKQYLKDNIQNGVSCPCCNRLVKLYSYNLNSGSTRSLIILYHAHRDNDGDWVHIQRYFASKKMNANGMNYILLKHWGLIESKPGNDDPKKRANGFWRITDKGISFVLGGLALPKYAYVYNNQAIKFSDELVTVREALGKKFDYQELIYRTPSGMYSQGSLI